MARNVTAAELQKGDEFFYQGELHRVTVNDEYGDEERKIYTYVVDRPLTAPFIIWWPNDQTVTLEETDEQFEARSASYTNAEFEAQFGRPRGEYDPPEGGWRK